MGQHRAPPLPEIARTAPPPVDWSRFARAYDWQLPLERAALAAAVELAEPSRDDAWLDLATGTGGVLRELARGPVRPSIVVGIDASTAMLDRVPPLPRDWTLEVGDARRLLFADGSFSVVTAAYLLHVVDAAARRQVVAEAHRVLRPGGRLVVVTPAWPRTRVARALYAALVTAAGSVTDAQNPFRPLDPRHDLTAASFEIEAVRHVGRGYPSMCVSATRAS